MLTTTLFKSPKMSFGFSVGDFITVSALALSIYNSCKNSSGDFKNISNEVGSLHMVLEKTTEYISDYSLDTDGIQRLGSLKNECNSVLEDTQDLLRKYRSLGTKKGRKLDKLRWALKDVSGIRQRLIVNANMLTAFNTALTNSSQARVESKLTTFIDMVDQFGYDCATSSPNEKSQAVLSECSRENVGRQYKQVSNSAVASCQLCACSGCFCGEQSCTRRSVMQAPPLLGRAVGGIPEHQTRSRHVYRCVSSKDSSIQVNGDIGDIQTRLHGNHVYGHVIAGGNSRQVNGDIPDAHVFLQFMKI